MKIGGLGREAAAQAYGRVRAALEAAGAPIGSLAPLIAAHALAEGLELEDWME